MTKKKLFLCLGIVAGALLIVGAITLPTEAAPPSNPPCSIILCPAPPPTCAPGQKLVIPRGECCYRCVPA